MALVLCLISPQALSTFGSDSVLGLLVRWLGEFLAEVVIVWFLGLIESDAVVDSEE